MKSKESALAPPARLAIAYARADLRLPFSLILRFDERIAGVVGRSNEPMIAQMKIAWWHDAIAAAVVDRPKGEPLLIELNEIDNKSLIEAMQQLLDAWEFLLAEEQWSAEILSQFENARGAAVFGTYAGWIGDDSNVKDIGEQWATQDLRLKFGVRVAANTAPDIKSMPKSRSLRPLTILAVAATEPTAFRMTWHALTGR